MPKSDSFLQEGLEMNQRIGILALDHLISPSSENEMIEGLRQSLPPGVEMLVPKTAGLEVLEFLENHKRLIILDKDISGFAQTLYGEVEYWAHHTGAQPEEVVVLSMNSLPESLANLQECLKRWNKRWNN